jgi:hypothetical protein
VIIGRRWEVVLLPQPPTTWIVKICIHSKKKLCSTFVVVCSKDNFEVPEFTLSLTLVMLYYIFFHLSSSNLSFNYPNSDLVFIYIPTFETTSFSPPTILCTTCYSYFIVSLLHIYTYKNCTHAPIIIYTLCSRCDQVVNVSPRQIVFFCPFNYLSTRWSDNLAWEVSDAMSNVLDGQAGFARPVCQALLHDVVQSRCFDPAIFSTSS